MRLMEGEHVGPFNLGNPGEFTMLELAQVSSLYFSYFVLVLLFKPCDPQHVQYKDRQVTIKFIALLFLGNGPIIL